MIEVACRYRLSTVAKCDRQANFECDFEGKSLYDSAVNCASIDFLLHVKTQVQRCAAITVIAEAKCGRIWPLSGVTDKKVHRCIWPLLPPLRAICADAIIKFAM